MSIHSSLSASLNNKKQRSVLKRIERIKHFLDKGSFNEETSVFGLPKIKVLKIKVKKEKTEEKAASGATPAKAEAKGAAPAAPAKGAAAAKPAK